MSDSRENNLEQFRREYELLLLRCEELQLQAEEAERSRDSMLISKERLRQIIDLVPNFIFAKDIDGRFILANRAVADAYGSTVECLLGRTDADFAQSADEVEQFRRDDQEVIRSGKPKIVAEERITDATGRIRILQTIKIPFRLSGSSAPAVLGVSTDISDLKRAETDRVELEKKILQAQKLESLGVLAGGIAHDFNNLLTGILGHADLAREGAEPGSSLHQNVEAVSSAARRAADLCRQLLAYTGKGHFVVESIDLNRLIHDMSQMLMLSIGRKAVLRLDLAASLSPVEADQSQIHQVIMNLLVNASEAVPLQGGSVTIRTSQVQCSLAKLREMLPGTERGLAGTYAMVEICDNGCGMDAATRARMFDPFFTTKFTGRGLGLAAVLGIVRGHQGAIDVRSTPGCGTSVRLYLPAISIVTTAANGPINASAEWRGSGVVLIVDDEPAVRDACSKMLAHMGFDAVCVASGQEAIERLGKAPFDEFCCVILDLTMPRIDGRETLRRMREQGYRVPVLLSSGYSNEHALQDATDLSYAGFIAKPYSYSELQSCMRGVLEKRTHD